MSETKWTPGPWKVEDGTVKHCGSLVITANHVGMQSNTPLARLGAFDEASRDDANLMASAPDLYDALDRSTSMLRSLMDQLHSYEHEPYVNARAQIGANIAILAKARGEVQS